MWYPERFKLRTSLKPCLVLTFFLIPAQHWYIHSQSQPKRKSDQCKVKVKQTKKAVESNNTVLNTRQRGFQQPTKKQKFDVPLVVRPLKWFFCWWVLPFCSLYSPYFGCFGFFMIGRVSSSLSLTGANERLFVYMQGFSPNVSSVVGLKCRST
jgi:hypothetical protein